MTEADMKIYIEENKKYVFKTIIVDAYDLDLISVYDMYIETRLSVLQHHIQYNNSQKQAKQNKEEIKKEKDFLFNEFGISQATFYRYRSKGIVKITNPILFRLMITTGRKSFIKELLNGTDNTYKTIANYVNTRIFNYNGNADCPIKYSYCFENEISPEYCYKLWHSMIESYYTSDTTYDFKLTIIHFKKVDTQFHLNITIENNTTTNPDTKITNTTWKIKESNYLSAIGKRIDSWYHLNNDEDNSSLFIVHNLSGNRKITRYLELVALINGKIMLFN